MELRAKSRHSSMHKFLPELWQNHEGKAVSCEEKIKILNENLIEIEALCKEALEDALLMGCDEDFVRQVLKNMINSLEKPFP